MSRSTRPTAPTGLLSRALAIGALGAGLALFLLLPGWAPAALLLIATGAALAPASGLLVCFATLPLYLVTRALGPLELSIGEVALLAAAAGFATRWLATLRRPAAPRWPSPTPLDWPTTAFLASALVSLLVTEYLRLSLRELRLLVLEPVLAYYLLRRHFPGSAMARPLVALLVGATAVAGSGLVGLAVGWGTSEAEGVHRLQATYPSANQLGLLLGRALPFLLALAALPDRRRWPAAGGVAVAGLALLATYSLGAWLGTAAALLAMAILAGRRRVGLIGLGLGAVGLLGLLASRPERLLSHLQPGQGTTFFRLQLWQSALAMLRDHPLLGVGLDNFLYLYQQRYIAPEALAEANLSHPHNLVLQFWLELGLLGLLAGLWLLGAGLRLARRAWYRSPDAGARALALGAFGCQVDFVVHGLIDNSYFLPDLALVFWLVLALLVEGNHHSAATIARHISGEERERSHRPADSAGRPGACRGAERSDQDR